MNSIRKKLLLIDKWVAVVCIIVDLIILFANVIGRYVFHQSIPWAEETGRYLMIIMIYLGISFSAYNGSHIRIDSVEKLYSPRVLPYVQLAGDILWVVYCGIIVYYGVDYTGYIYGTGARMVAVSIPLWPIYATIPIGHFCMGIRVLMTVYDKIIALANKNGDYENSRKGERAEE